MKRERKMDELYLHWVGQGTAVAVPAYVNDVQRNDQGSIINYLTIHTNNSGDIYNSYSSMPSPLNFTGT